MTEAPCVFFRLLLFMLSLIVIGEPLRVILSRYFSFFKKLDILQIFVLNVYLGGLILYTTAIIPLHLFDATMAWGIIITCCILSTLLHWKELRNVQRIIQSNQEHMVRIHNYLLAHKVAILGCAVVLAMFLAALWIQIIPLPNFIFGSIHDTSLHALFTQVILENEQVPTTLQPYLSEGILYPQGAHALFAFACYIFGYIPPEAIFHVTALFQALTTLGAYYLGKALSSKRLGISFAFVFFCVSRWPRLLTWGGNPYVTAFPLQFICFSFIPLILSSQLQDKLWKKTLELSVLGIIIGYLATLHLTLYFILVTAAALLALVNALRKRVLHELRNLLITVGFSLIPISPFIYRFVMWYPLPGHNVGLPSDLTIPPWPLVNMLDWVLYCEGISPYYPLVFAVIGLIIASGITIYLKKKQLAETFNATKIASSALIASVVLFILFHLQYVLPSLAVVTGEVQRPTISILVSFCFFISVFNVLLYDALSSNLYKRLTRVFLQAKRALANVTSILLALLIFSSIYSPFIYYMIAGDVGYLTRSYGLFSVTTSDDYELMFWIRDNLGKNASILVNPYEPGAFIPSISYYKAIYPWVLSRDRCSFQELFNMTQQGIMNATVYDTMDQLGITHVYVGARYSYWWEKNRKWDPQIFLSNPNFNLTKKIGKAYLFEVLYVKPNIVLEDNFEYENVSDGGWEFSFAGGHLYNGSGYVTTNSSCAYHSLVIAAKNERGIFYSNWVHRRIYVWDTSNVTLSFYINASNGFNPPDRLVIYISDLSWRQFVFFVTPSYPYAENVSAVTLPDYVGTFSFNISEIWNQRHNSTLPSPFFLIIQNMDFDGIENVAYIDDVKVKVCD